jgi:hypothetical protein
MPWSPTNSSGSPSPSKSNASAHASSSLPNGGTEGASGPVSLPSSTRARVLRATALASAWTTRRARGSRDQPSTHAPRGPSKHRPKGRGGAPSSSETGGGYARASAAARAQSVTRGAGETDETDETDGRGDGGDGFDVHVHATEPRLSARNVGASERANLLARRTLARRVPCLLSRGEPGGSRARRDAREDASRDPRRFPGTFSVAARVMGR